MVEQWRPILIEAAGQFAKTVVEQVMTARVMSRIDPVRVNPASTEPQIPECAYCAVAKAVLWATVCMDRAIAKEAFRGTYTELARIALVDALNLIRHLPSEIRRAELQMHVGKILGRMPMYGISADISSIAAECNSIVELALDMAERSESEQPKGYQYGSRQPDSPQPSGS